MADGWCRRSRASVSCRCISLPCWLRGGRVGWLWISDTSRLPSYLYVCPPICADPAHAATQVIGTRVLTPCLTTTPLAGRAFLARLRTLLLAFGRYRPPHSARIAGMTSTASERAGMIDPADERWGAGQGWERVPKRVLGRDTLEDVRIRCCSVARRGQMRGLKGQAGRPLADEPELGDEDVALAEQLQGVYGGSDGLPVATLHASDPDSGTTGEQGTLEVPGWVRQAAAEVFFERGDEDQASVVEAVLGCLRKVGCGVYEQARDQVG